MIVNKSRIKNSTRIRIAHFKNINAIIISVSDRIASHRQHCLNLIFQQIDFGCFLHIQNNQKIPIGSTSLMN